MKGLHDLTGFETFRREDPFAVSEETAWELAAMSVHRLAAGGCYRGPTKHLYIFFAIDEIADVAGERTEPTAD